MPRLTSALRFALPLALLLGAATTPALAEWKLDAVYYAPNSTTAVFVDGDRKCYVTYTGPNNPYIVVYLDTGPDDAGSEKNVEKPDVVSMLKHAKISYTVTLAPEQTPLVKWIDRGGFGFNPHGNPGDTDTGISRPGQPPKRYDPDSKDSKLTAKQIASIDRLYNAGVRLQQILGAGMGSGEEGGTEAAPGLDKNNNTGNRNNSGKNNDSDNGKNKILGRAFDDLGPRPDLVNPPHGNLRLGVKATTATITSHTISSVGTSSSGTARTSVIGPGLLEGGGGLTGQGPSAVGARIGSGARGPSAAGIR